METIVLNIRLSNRRTGEASLLPLPCYYYNIEGIGVMLYDYPEQKKWKYQTAEFFTGRHIASADTMQEALDKAAAIIHRYGAEHTQKKIEEHFTKTVPANNLDCPWCGKQHMGGPEYCKE